MRILGIIGIFLLTLLKILFLVLLALLVLLVIILCISIRYEATGRAEGANFGEGLEAHIRLTALLGLASLRGILRGGDFLYSFRIAGKTIRKGRRRKDAAVERSGTGSGYSGSFSEEEEFSDREKTSAGEKALEREAISGTEESPEELSEPEEFSAADESSAPEKTSDSEKTVDSEQSSGSGGTSDSEESHAAEEISGSENKPGKQRSARRENRKNRGEAPEGEKTTSEKFSSGWEKAKCIWEKLQEPSFQKTLSRVKKAAGKILRHILPQELRGKAVAGTGDPALTGQLVGLFYACWPLYGENWDLELSGDFEKKRLQGKVYMKGRIRLLTIIGIVLGLLLDKNILRLIWSRLKRKKG